MTKKEIRKAAKGCGFKKIERTLSRVLKVINRFRKEGSIKRGDVSAQDDATELACQVEFDKLHTAFEEAVQAFRNNTIPVDAEEAYKQKPEKKAKKAA